MKWVPFLNTGETFVLFQTEGKFFLLRERLNILLNGSQMTIAASFNILEWMRSGPTALFISRVVSLSLTSSGASRMLLRDV